MFFFISLGLFINGCVAVNGFIVAVSPTFDVALLILNFACVFYTLLCGFYVTYDNIPVYYKWLNWLCLYRYGIFAMFINEYDTAGTDDFADIIAGRNENPDWRDDVLNQAVMSYYNVPIFEAESKYIDMAIMLLLTIGFRFTTYVALLYMHKEQR